MSSKIMAVMMVVFNIPKVWLSLSSSTRTKKVGNRNINRKIFRKGEVDRQAGMIRHDQPLIDGDTQGREGQYQKHHLRNTAEGIGQGNTILLFTVRFPKNDVFADAGKYR